MCEIWNRGLIINVRIVTVVTGQSSGLFLCLVDKLYVWRSECSRSTSAVFLPSCQGGGWWGRGWGWGWGCLSLSLISVSDFSTAMCLSASSDAASGSGAMALITTSLMCTANTSTEPVWKMSQLALFIALPYVAPRQSANRVQGKHVQPITARF